MAKVHPKDDSRSIEELVNVALDNADEDVAWGAIGALQWRGSQDVVRVAQDLCIRTNPRERQLGCDILGQLGVPERTFPEECKAIILNTLREESEPTVLRSIFIALSFLSDKWAISAVTDYTNHPNEEVRQAVVLALNSHKTEDSIAMILKLTTDSSSLVRDWATFSIGTQIEEDTPTIRDALAARLFDIDSNVRGEALVGLANRGDIRAIASIAEGELPFTETDHFAEAKLILEDKGLL